MRALADSMIVVAGSRLGLLARSWWSLWLLVGGCVRAASRGECCLIGSDRVGQDVNAGEIHTESRGGWARVSNQGSEQKCAGSQRPPKN